MSDTPKTISVCTEESREKRIYKFPRPPKSFSGKISGNTKASCRVYFVEGFPYAEVTLGGVWGGETFFCLTDSKTKDLRKFSAWLLKAADWLDAAEPVWRKATQDAKEEERRLEGNYWA